MVEAGSKKAVLFVGTQTNLLAYDVDSNADLFYKDMPDGVRYEQSKRSRRTSDF